MLYQILVGQAPLGGPMFEMLARLGAPEPMPSPREAPAPVPPELAAICDKALRKAPSERYRDAGELAAEIRAYRDGRLVSTYAYSRTELLRRSVARNKLAVTAGLIAIAGIIAGAGLAVDFGRKAQEARLVAQAAERQAIAAHRRTDAALDNITRIADVNLTQAGTLARTLTRALAEAAGAPLPAGFYAGLGRSDSASRAVWIIDGNGTLVYGPDATEIGRNFFHDERYKANPSLRHLTGEVRDQDAGIGFYEYPALNGDVSYHIAAWQAAEIEGASPWKVAVVEIWK
jgi:hypothetical protein